MSITGEGDCFWPRIGREGYDQEGGVVVLEKYINKISFLGMPPSFLLPIRHFNPTPQYPKLIIWQGVRGQEFTMANFESFSIRDK